MSITSNKPFRIFDAAATGDALAKELFKALPEGSEKSPSLGAKINQSPSRSGITDFYGCKPDLIALGPIGRDGPQAEALNSMLEKYIPVIIGLVEKEFIVPNPYDIVGKGGFEDVIEAYKYQQKGAGGSNKVIVKVQDP
jgi:hypothetical protein